jgi:hypothetical protein
VPRVLKERGGLFYDLDISEGGYRRCLRLQREGKLWEIEHVHGTRPISLRHFERRAVERERARLLATMADLRTRTPSRSRPGSRGDYSMALALRWALGGELDAAMKREIVEHIVEKVVISSDLVMRLTEMRLEWGPDGSVRAPEGAGLGVRPNLECVREYLQPVWIEVAGEVLYRTPSVDD